MGGPVAPASTHVHSQQQSHAYTSSFNRHRSSEEMEKNVTKEGVCETNVGNVVTKSSSHPTSVGFVSDIEKKKTGKCGHFSIRAYVAEICRKDWKICWPFSSLDDYQESKKLADMLPSLDVPEFRWWDCQNCVQRDKLGESSNSDVNTSTDVISSELCPMIHDHMKEMVANVVSIIRPACWKPLISSSQVLRILWYQ